MSASATHPPIAEAAAWPREPITKGHEMTTLSRAYTSAHDAEKGIERLLAAGVEETKIELIIGRAIEDSRDAPIGFFAGTTTADAETVGSYANIEHSGREATGTFAGDADKQRRGAFSDTDRDTVTTYQSGAKRTRIASHHGLTKILVDSGLDEATATANVEALHAGRVLVLVQSELPLDNIAAMIDDHGQGHDFQETLRAAA
jgi:hypothetical protein